MLVLNRQIGEVIRIGDDIEVMVVAVFGDDVRIGIKAPKDIPVHRQEVYYAINNQAKGTNNES